MEPLGARALGHCRLGLSALGMQGSGSRGRGCNLPAVRWLEGSRRCLIFPFSSRIQTDVWQKSKGGSRGAEPLQE